jgi:hypothetical protein
MVFFEYPDYLELTTCYSCRTSFSATPVPVGAIIGGAIGGAAFLLLSMIIMFILLRRRIRRARVTFTIEDSEEFHSPPQAEEDMPPPEYQRIFPTVRARSLRALAWAGSTPRRKRGRIVAHPGIAGQPSTLSGNVATLHRVEIPQRAGAEVRSARPCFSSIQLKRYHCRWRTVTLM